MEPLHAGIDAGTAGCAVVLFDGRGAVVGAGDAAYACTYPERDRVEQELELVWRGLCAAAREALRGLDPRAVASISVASQRGTFALVDGALGPLGPSIVWSDGRATAEAAELERRLGPGRFARLAGASPSRIWTAAKVRWLADHRPELLARAARLVNGQEWLLARLGAGLLGTEASSAAMSGMLDVARLDWSDEILEACGISRALLPPVVAATTGAGALSRAAGQATGFAEGTPLFYGGGDQQCAAAGAGVIAEGGCMVAVGTGSVVLTPVAFHRAGAAPGEVVQGAHVVPGLRAAEAIALSTGNCVKWWRALAHGGEEPAAGHAAIDREAAGVAPGADGVLFLPFFAGQCLPDAPGGAAGAFLGLGSRHGRAELSRAVLEGVTCELRWRLEAVEAFAGRRLDPVRVTGGGATSDQWMGLAASILGRALERPQVRECTALGAAMLGAVGAGRFQDLAAAAAGMVRQERVFLPEAAVAERYQDVYAAWRRAVPPGDSLTARRA
jgi:xylulokinase